MSDDQAIELADLLDKVSYELSSARAAGISRPEELRAALKKARELVSDADALAQAAGAQRREDEA
ncbi:MAG: hypothetical protein ACRDLB_06615 [Actinomycetota bacterium]